MMSCTYPEKHPKEHPKEYPKKHPKKHWVWVAVGLGRDALRWLCVGKTRRVAYGAVGAFV